jgi:hypothetical protein
MWLRSMVLYLLGVLSIGLRSLKRGERLLVGSLYVVGRELSSEGKGSGGETKMNQHQL